MLAHLPRWIRPVLAAMTLTLLWIGTLGNIDLTVSPVEAKPKPPAPFPTDVQTDEPILIVVRAYYPHRQMAYDLVTWLEPWEVHHDQGYLVAAVTSDEYERLEQAGFRVEVDQALTAQLNQPAPAPPSQVNGIPNYACYRTVEETFATAQTIVADYPHLATWIDIGDSWEKTQDPNQGYDLQVLRLTHTAIPGPKPKLFIMTSVHAREYTPAELGTRFAEYLVTQYDQDADVTWLLDYHEIHLLLQANPDGRKKAEAGIMWRKNTNENYCAFNSNDHGADLNRNFSFQWNCCGGSSNNPCDNTYHGPSPASEPETQAIQNYLRAQFPDQRADDLDAAAPITATGVFLDIHSYSELVLWSWGFDYTPTPNSTALQTLGRKFAYFNGYKPQQASELYPTDGSTDDFAYGELGLAAYSFELGTAFFQDCTSFEETILPDNLPALLYAAQVTRTPYLTPAGPDTLQPTLAPIIVPLDGTAQLTATIDDTRYNQSNGVEATQTISAAEYYIDTPPWVTTTIPVANPMTALDGALDQKTETVSATIDTSDLNPGRHIIFVRGQDMDGNWGPVGATFLYLVDLSASPTVTGNVRQARTDAPLAATVTAGPFQVETDPVTGYYSMTLLSGTFNLQAVAPDHVISTVVGLDAQDGQTINQDFYLDRICGIVFDDAEGGNQNWTAQSPWAITPESAHSPYHSWSDSPGGDYADNRDVSLTSPLLDLSGYRGVTLSFWHTFALEEGYDYGRVEYSTDGGRNWQIITSYTGSSGGTWTPQTFSLPALDGQPQVYLRFRLLSDANINADGWHIDDISLTGGGPACTSPVAAFTNDSPVIQGQAMHFTNLTTGSLPLYYHWDWGDGLGTSTVRDPAYTYQQAGQFTVTLSVSNPLGQDSVRHPVTVLSSTYGVALTPVSATQTAGLGHSATHYLTVTNQGNQADQLLLHKQGETWSTTLSIKTTPTLPPLQSTQVQVLVSVPLTASVGQTDSVTLIATSSGQQTQVSTSTLTTIAGPPDYAVELEINKAMRRGTPGAIVTHTLTAHNRSLVQDSLNANLSGHNWETTLSTEILAHLAASTTMPLYVYVTIPPTASDGATDIVTVSVTSQGDNAQSDHVALTTMARWSRCYLPLLIKK